MTQTLPNVRDLGGLPTLDGRETRTGVLYRSAAPLPGDPAPDTLPRWPSRTVIDLRAPAELTTAHPLRTDGVTVHSLPFFTQDQLLDLPRTSLHTLYRHFTEHAATQLVRVLEVATRGEPPVLVHCAAGKDRTGVAIAMLLACAGVPRDAIIADYHRTEEHLDAIHARLPRHNPLYTPPPGTTDGLFGAPPEAIGTVLDLWSQHPGGVRGWLVTHGADPTLPDQWTARFTSAR